MYKRALAIVRRNELKIAQIVTEYEHDDANGARDGMGHGGRGKWSPRDGHLEQEAGDCRGTVVRNIAGVEKRLPSIDSGRNTGE
jgi:hypothetical protein